MCNQTISQDTSNIVKSMCFAMQIFLVANILVMPKAFAASPSVGLSCHAEAPLPTSSNDCRGEWIFYWECPKPEKTIYKSDWTQSCNCDCPYCHHVESISASKWFAGSSWCQPPALAPWGQRSNAVPRDSITTGLKDLASMDEVWLIACFILEGWTQGRSLLPVPHPGAWNGTSGMSCSPRMHKQVHFSWQIDIYRHDLHM